MPEIPQIDSEQVREALRKALEDLGLKTGHIKITPKPAPSAWRDVTIEVRRREIE
jgi:hypothetical protein